MLRQELMLPSINDAEVKKLTDLATKIVSCMDMRQDYSLLIAEFNTMSGGEYDISDFEGAASSMDMDEFAKQVLTPPPPKLSDITDAEYLEIITRLLEGQASEAEVNYWLRLLDINIPCPLIFDLIFWSDNEPTAEQILAKARQWRPIIL